MNCLDCKSGGPCCAHSGRERVTKEEKLKLKKAGIHNPLMFLTDVDKNGIKRRTLIIDEIHCLPQKSFEEQKNDEETLRKCLQKLTLSATPIISKEQEVIDKDFMSSIIQSVRRSRILQQTATPEIKYNTKIIIQPDIFFSKEKKPDNIE